MTSACEPESIRQTASTESNLASQVNGLSATIGSEGGRGMDLAESVMGAVALLLFSFFSFDLDLGGREGGDDKVGNPKSDS
jgi:hypothetical protein